MMTSDDVNLKRGQSTSSSTGFTSDVLPEVRQPLPAVNSQTGVSTNNALSGNAPHWYALRTTYGREMKAYDYMTSKGVSAFCPSKTVIKVINGKRKVVNQSLIPNLFFAYGTEDEIKVFVYDNTHLPYLRFYYRHFHVGNKIEKIPLIVPDNQLDSLKIICSKENEDIIITPIEIQKFKKGQMVKITKGPFKGVTGHVARYQGQQRVGVIINELMTIATAYIPSAYIQ